MTPEKSQGAEFGPNNHKLHRLNRHRHDPNAVNGGRRKPLPSEVGNHIKKVRRGGFEDLEEFTQPKPEDIADKGDEQ